MDWGLLRTQECGMSGFVISLVSGGGIAALGVCVAAYYYGVKTGRSFERDMNDAKVLKIMKKMQAAGLVEVSVKDVQDSLTSGTF